MNVSVLLGVCPVTAVSVIVSAIVTGCILKKTLDGKDLEINDFKEMEYLICIDCANAIALLFNSAYQNVVCSSLEEYM